MDWHLLGYPEHAGVQALVRALNTVYRHGPALWEQDFDWPGFRWIDPDDSDEACCRSCGSRPPPGAPWPAWPTYAGAPP